MQSRRCSSCGEEKARPDTKRRFWLGVRMGLPLGEETRFRCHGCGARFGVMNTTMRAVHGALAALGVVAFFVLLPFRSAVPLPLWPWVSALAPWLLVAYAGGLLAFDVYRDRANPPG